MQPTSANLSSRLRVIPIVEGTPTKVNNPARKSHIVGTRSDVR